MLIGLLTKHPLAVDILAKRCALCDSRKRRNKELQQDHDCSANYEGSSKGMEAPLLISLLTKLHDERNVKVETIVSDDDSTMRARCRHSYAEKIAAGLLQERPRDAKGNLLKDRGLLPLRVQELKFLADPSHRTKVAGKAVYGVCTMKRSETEGTKCDAMRLKRNFGATR